MGRYQAFVFLLIIFVNEALSQRVETNSGPVMGKTVKKNAVRPVNVIAFYDIPYAKPPVGDLRFARTQPVDAWSETHDAKQPRHVCFQPQGPPNPFVAALPPSEDCLTLSIFTPSLSGTRAVMVFFHGGSFFQGSGNAKLYDGTLFASKQSVVMVTVNYRLGPLGFLAVARNSGAPGNAGLLDQLEALKWIKMNIARFGGNPSKVTIFGESAGSISVGLHVLSPLSTDYFTRGIMESGLPIMYNIKPLSYAEARSRAVALARAANCTDTTSDNALLTCLRSVDAQTLANLQFSAGPPVMPFSFNRDNYFLVDEPRSLLESGQAKKCPLIVGFNENEGALFLYTLLAMANITDANQPNLELSKDQFERTWMMTDYINEKERVQQGIRFFYQGTNYNQPYLQMLINYMGDPNFISKAVEFSKLHSKNGNDVFFYQYNYDISYSLFPKWLGAAHTLELFTLFGEPLRKPNLYNGNDRSVAEKLMEYWANFAKTGSPNADLTRPPWPKFLSGSNEYAANFQQYIYFNGQSPYAHQDRAPVFSRANFWNTYIPQLLNDTTVIVEKDCTTTTTTSSALRTIAAPLFALVTVVMVTLINY